MASLLSTSSAPVVTLPHSAAPRAKCTIRQIGFSAVCAVGGLIFVPKIQISKAATRSYQPSRCSKTTISCSIVVTLSIATYIYIYDETEHCIITYYFVQAQPETLQIVQSTIAKQLSIDESTVNPQTKFADLGADSLDTVCSF
ncbi:unnamed protein product [Ilex paraguariensis]|uniref:Carrier domain-containing protein n=1 Tax=Ilex paraguariensis TaxID=185542 RepID=A0ABC8RI50_9AQUA